MNKLTRLISFVFPAAVPAVRFVSPVLSTLTVAPGALGAAAMFALSATFVPTVAAHDVTVFSYVTPAGQSLASPTPGQQSHCRLVSAGYRESGPVPAGESPANPERVDTSVRRAAQVNAYAPLRAGETADLVLVYQWGVMSPDFVPTGTAGTKRLINGDQMLALVGGSVLPKVDLESDRETILTAARDERYFLVVSAFDSKDAATSATPALLWRTQMSVPTGGLTQEQAFPLLAAAGGPLFGRATPLPRTIALPLADTLRMEARR